MIKAFGFITYGGNVFDDQLADGSRVKLTQKTDYPWDGKIVVTLDDVESAEPFAIRMRVPAWATEATATVNGVSLRKFTCGRASICS